MVIDPKVDAAVDDIEHDGQRLSPHCFEVRPQVVVVREQRGEIVEERQTLPVTWDDGAARWVPASRGTIDATATTAVTPHFSRWGLLRWDPETLRADLGAGLRSMVGPAFKQGNGCEGTVEAEAPGAAIQTSGGDPVRSCIGSRKGISYLKVTNPQGFAVSVEYPSGLRPGTRTPSQPLLDAVASGAGAIANGPSPFESDRYTTPPAIRQDSPARLTPPARFQHPTTSSNATCSS